MLLRFFAVIAGFALQTGAIFGLEWISGKIYPPPPGLDLHDPAQLGAMIASRSPWAFALVLAGYLLGALLGAHTATEIMGGKSPWPGRVVTGLGLLGLALNVIEIPHPAWFIAAAAFCFVIGGLSGLRLGGWKGAPAAAAPAA